MKTERNAPCPCGSGKKYKKCCWNKEIENQSTLETNFLKTEQSDYTYIEPIANKLGNILKKVSRYRYCKINILSESVEKKSLCFSTKFIFKLSFIQHYYFWK